ncbi:MAG: hypothetical protein ABIL51_06095 [candidate division WOR-3 bacterium]
MKRYLILLAFFGLPVLGYAQDQGGKISEEETVVGTAEYKIDDAVKPIVDLQLRPFEPVDSFILLKEKGLEKRLPAGIDKELSEVVKLNNPFLRRPVYPVMIVDKIVIKPGKLPKPDNWKIVVYNSAGIPVKTFEGRGGVPNEIVWDGISDKGVPAIKPGERFTYRIYLERKSGAKRREVREIPEIVGFAISDPKGDNMIYLNTDYVFQPGRANLQPDGEERIVEMLNFLKAKYKGNGPVEVYVYATNNFLYEDRAKVLRELILKNAPIDPEKLKINQGYFQSGAKYERIELKFRD